MPAGAGSSNSLQQRQQSSSGGGCAAAATAATLFVCSLAVSEQLLRGQLIGRDDLVEPATCLVPGKIRGCASRRHPRMARTKRRSAPRLAATFQVLSFILIFILSLLKNIIHLYFLSFNQKAMLGKGASGSERGTACSGGDGERVGIA